MKSLLNITLLIVVTLALSSCASKKQLTVLEADLATNQQEKNQLKADLKDARTKLDFKDQQISSLKDQLDDCRNQRDKQLTQVGDLTVLSQSASENIKETLSQLESKDKYIRLIQAAKTKADSINLALAVNLKSVLKKGLDDEDVEIKVDKTVVFINLSDKMLYKSGSSNLTDRAHEVLGKIAQIIETRPGIEVMVEGYTDNVPIKTDCLDDNWDLSVKRSTSVVRVLQEKYQIDPNILIAAGRGEYNTLAGNDTKEGRATNRRTRIIIMPKLNQFYDLLNPDKAPGNNTGTGTDIDAETEPEPEDE